MKKVLLFILCALIYYNKLFSSNCVALFLSFGRFRSLGQFLIIGLNGHFPSPIINHDSRWYHETGKNFKNAVITNYLLDDFLNYLTFFSKQLLKYNIEIKSFHCMHGLRDYFIASKRKLFFSYLGCVWVFFYLSYKVDIILNWISKLGFFRSRKFFRCAFSSV